MMRFSLAGNKPPTIFILTEDPRNLNEVSRAYALGFYVVFIAFPTVVTQGTPIFKAPICTLERPW